MRILFLEDEPAIREVLTEYMKMSGYIVDAVSDGLQAVNALDQREYDLAVLDIMVPKISGIEVLKKIKEEKHGMASVMLTAIDDEQTQIEAFDLYADDYIVKPVSPMILLKRLETILRRTKGGKNETSGFSIDTASYQAFYNQKPLNLTLSEFLLLQTLYDHPSQVFTREQLVLRIFNEDYLGNDRIIDAHIKNIRKKVPVDVIKTVIGVGYQYKEAVN